MHQKIFPTDRSWVNVSTADGTNLFVETGYAKATWSGQDVHGADRDDQTWTSVEYALHVGPYFTRVLQAAPLVYLARWGNDNSDEDDRQGFEISAAKWTLAEYNPPGGFQVVILFAVSWRGANSYPDRLAYQVTVEAERILGEVEKRSGYVEMLVEG